MFSITECISYLHLILMIQVEHDNSVNSMTSFDQQVILTEYSKCLLRYSFLFYVKQYWFCSWAHWSKIVYKISGVNAQEASCCSNVVVLTCLCSAGCNSSTGICGALVWRPQSRYNNDRVKYITATAQWPGYRDKARQRTHSAQTNSFFWEYFDPGHAGERRWQMWRCTECVAECWQIKWRKISDLDGNGSWPSTPWMIKPFQINNPKGQKRYMALKYSPLHFRHENSCHPFQSDHGISTNICEIYRKKN